MAKILDRLQDSSSNITFSQNTIAPSTSYIINSVFEVSSQYELSVQVNTTLSQASNGTSSFTLDVYNSIDGTTFDQGQIFMSIPFTPDSTNTTFTYTSQNIDITSLRYIKLGITNNLGVIMSQNIISDKALF